MVNIKFTYKNWKGVTSVRNVIPMEIYYGTEEHYPNITSWFMKAYDFDKNDIRHFLLTEVNFKDID